MKFTIYQESRLGKRSKNEDRLAHCYSRKALLMVVADGMGGHCHGEIAAQTAVQTLTQAFQREATPEINDPFRFLQQAMNDAHRAILALSAEHQLDDSPRTTCVACITQGNVAYWAHAGDSRLYLLRDGKVLLRTRDHSHVQLLIEQGAISEAQAASHPERNKVYSCLGGAQNPRIEFSSPTPLAAGDVLALCTDGLWGPLPGELLAVGLKDASLTQAVPMLLGQAEIRSGAQADNLSMLAVRWEDSYRDGAVSAAQMQTLSHDTCDARHDAPDHHPSDTSVLSEDEIERAIEEIRATIRQHARQESTCAPANASPRNCATSASPAISPATPKDRS